MRLDEPYNSVQSVREKIKQFRHQMLVHSYIYYKLDDEVISDHEWQDRANQLRDIQKEYGEKIGFYDEAFKDWTGVTGCDLPQDDWIRGKARWLLDYENSIRS